jgi:predicted aconitase
MMKLTTQEQTMLDGQCGYPVQKSMEILVALGEAYDADIMIPVNHVHLATGAILVAGDGWSDFVQEMTDSGGRLVVRATTNPSSIDPVIYKELGVSETLAEKQMRYSENLRRLGATLCHTCAPYLIGFIPQMGEHIVSGESSNIAYMNSVLGVRTNRAGAPLGLAAALTGRIPYHGLHVTENRRGDVLVRVKTPLSDPTDYGLLGLFIGDRLTDSIPVFDGLPSSIPNEALKQLGAALNSSGAIPLFHIVGVTPEAPTMEAAFQGDTPRRVLEVTEKDIDETREYLNSATGAPNWIAVGCPHTSIWEIRELVDRLDGRRIHGDVEFWVCAAEPVRAYAERMGYRSALRKSGVRIVCETCPAIAPADEIACRLGNVAVMATNSAKLAHYMPSEWGIKSLYGSTHACVDAAVSGKWG